MKNLKQVIATVEQLESRICQLEEALRVHAHPGMARRISTLEATTKHYTENLSSTAPPVTGPSTTAPPAQGG